jgi:hypothetical protein
MKLLHGTVVYRAAGQESAQHMPGLIFLSGNRVYLDFAPMI